MTLSVPAIKPPYIIYLCQGAYVTAGLYLSDFFQNNLKSYKPMMLGNLVLQLPIFIDIILQV